MKKYLLGLTLLLSISAFGKSLTMYDCTYERDNGFDGHLVIGEKVNEASYDYNGKFLKVKLTNNKLKMSISDVQYAMYPNIDALNNTVMITLDKDFDGVITMSSGDVLLGCKKEVIKL